MKKSQKQQVLTIMREQGFVTRNWALQNFISRLSAIILSLRKEGMNITAEFKDGDYIYKLEDKPKKVEEYRVQGELVARKVFW